MATRKTTFEVVPLAAIAPLLKDAELLGSVEETGPKTAPQPAKILSVANDMSLASTREMLLTSVGFQVSSALTVGQAIQLCATEEFALVVIGHSIPRDHGNGCSRSFAAAAPHPSWRSAVPGKRH